MTPESKVKKQVSALLKKYEAYYEMPVPSGFGKQGLDYNGCHKGRYFAIETKAPGKTPTARQLLAMRDVVLAGGAAFWTDGPLGAIEDWLKDPT